MALKSLPIQFLNLGGEMMYIIDQRLRAQEIPKERADKGNFYFKSFYLTLNQKKFMMISFVQTLT